MLGESRIISHKYNECEGPELNLTNAEVSNLTGRTQLMVRMTNERGNATRIGAMMMDPAPALSYDSEAARLIISIAD